MSYLFDPDTSTEGKKSYQNVTGLFQVDEDGYYYYDARKNFAEFKESSVTTKDGTQSDGSFTLYDGPAVWRTDAGYNSATDAFDGDMGLGNFFLFDSASRVLTGFRHGTRMEMRPIFSPAPKTLQTKVMLFVRTTIWA